MKKAAVGEVAFWGLLAWTVLATALIVRASHGRPDPPMRSAAPDRPVHIAGWREIAAHGHATGPADAAMTMVVFSDFQCPFCRRFAGVVDSLRQRHPEVRVVERNFPIVALHPSAFNAALAAECAAHSQQYAAMRHVLFSKGGLVTEGEWGLLARDAGIVDTTGFRRCVMSAADSSVIRADMAAAEEIGVHATPTIVVNDSVYVGGLPLDELERRAETLASSR